MNVFNYDQQYINSQIDRLDTRYGSEYKIQISDNQGNKTKHLTITPHELAQIQKILVGELAQSIT